MICGISYAIVELWKVLLNKSLIVVLVKKITMIIKFCSASKLIGVNLMRIMMIDISS